MGTIEIAPTAHDFGPVHDRMQHYVDAGILSSVETLVLRGTDVVDRATFGSMSIEGGEPLREDAIYRVYSNTKIVTAVAAMALLEQGRFSLDDPLAEHLPEFADMEVLVEGATDASQTEPAEPILVRHLLTHTAGLSYGFIEPMSVIDQAYGAAGVNVAGDDDLATFSRRVAALPLAFQPGTSWRYSVAIDVVGRLVEVLTGEAFDEHLRRTVFEPLGMVDTSFWVPEDRRDRLITMYSPEDLFDPMAPGLRLADAPETSSYRHPPAMPGGGGGLVSTVADYLTFLRMLISEGEWGGVRILQPESVRAMRTNHLDDGVEVRFPMWAMPGTTMGPGLAIKERPGEDEPAASRGEVFWGGMAGTHTWWNPRTGLGGMALTQRMPGFWHPFAHDFHRMVHEIVDP